MSLGRLRPYVLLAFSILVAGTVSVNAGWQALVRYRIEDGLAFTRDIPKTYNYHTLSGHRCAATVSEVIWCIEFPEADAAAYSIGTAFCYTAFPVSCATPGNDEQVDFSTCSKVFPHGFRHFQELLIGE